MKPIYEPKGAAKEYGEFALNIYTGCPHRCFYCYSPNVLHIDRTRFHTEVFPRKNIVEATRRQLEREQITGKTIHLCFTCDPYPKGYDSSPTRQIIALLKESGNHVQILTKNGADAMRDFDLLDGNDWFGITFAGYHGCTYGENFIPPEEPRAGAPCSRLAALVAAKSLGINTWVSCEPVINPTDVLNFIDNADYVDVWKVGKLNYHYSSIDWQSFAENVTRLLHNKQKLFGTQYYIKESLRKEMEK